MQPEFVREQLAASKIQRKRERARQLRANIDADKKEEARASNAYRIDSIPLGHVVYWTSFDDMCSNQMHKLKLQAS